MDSIPTAESHRTASDGWTLESLRRDASRLQSELSLMMNAVPGKHRPISKLARWLEVDRALVHRFASATLPAADPLEVFDRLPGLDGLKTVANAIAAKSRAREVVSAAQVAAELYETLLGLAGGSQNKLRRRAADLREGAATDAREDRTAARRAIFESAVTIAGVQSSAFVISQFWRPSAASPGRLESLAMIGHYRVHRRSPEALPVLMSISSQVSGTFSEALALDSPRTPGINPAALLTRFSSDPFPRIVSAGDAQYTRDIVDSDPDSPDPFDVFVIRRVTRDFGDASYGLEAIPRIPTQNLILDLYVHRDLQPHSLYHGLFFVGVAGPVRKLGPHRWFDRLDPSLPPAGEGEQLPDASAIYPRHGELTRYLFDELNWSPDDYRNGRWVVPFPVWGCDHVLGFEGVVPDNAIRGPQSDLP